MYQSRSDYDRGVNTFSPDGRLFQVEYAIEAIKLGSTSIGIQTSEGVVLAAERRITSTLMEPRSIEKVSEIDSHVGCAMSGLVSDAKTLLDHARVDSQNYTFTYNEPMPIESITQSVCDLALRFGEDRDRKGSMSRPFGVALLIGGIDAQLGPILFHTDPAGTYFQYLAVATGSGHEEAQKQLEEEYHKSITLEEAKSLALKVLRQVMREKISSINVEVGIIPTTTKKFQLLETDEIQVCKTSIESIINNTKPIQKTIIDALPVPEVE